MISKQMPKYKCHKEVYALKIKYIVKHVEDNPEQESDGSAVITPEEEGYGDFSVNWEYLSRHNPQVGGYYVIYDDGYASFSPASAFESGYSLIQ